MVNNKDSVKIYKVLITQTGTNAPTVKILQNTLGEIIWTRNIAGDYIGTGTGLFIAAETATHVANTNAPMSTFRRLNNDQVGLTTFTGAAALQDGLLNQTLLTIEVYNQYENYEY